jgi:hypothetical protein
VAAAGGKSGAGGTSGAGGASTDGGAGGASGAAGADAGTITPGCATGLVCADQCVTPNDVHRCGSCTNECAALPNVSATGLACTDGACSFQCLPQFADCAGTKKGCPDDLSLPTQCGGCGVVCPSSKPLCAPTAAGTYACAAACPAIAPDTCGSTCADTTSDPRNCSTCGRACSTTVAHAVPACSGGLCGVACEPSYTLCSGACVDITSDPNNCGGCGATFACATPKRCRASACVCPMTCGGTCVDPDTDGKNCGACGHDCLGGKCSGGACQPLTLASAQGMPECLALDATGVYWTNQADGKITKVSLDGATVTPIGTDEEPFGVAVDGTSVYWVNGGYDAAVRKAPLAGGTAVTLATGTAGRSTYRAIGLDATNVYWADDLNGGGIYAAPIDGSGTGMKIISSAPNGPCHIAVQASRLYWLGYPGQDTVESGPTTGGTATRLYALPENLGGSWAIAVNATRIYWTEMVQGLLISLPLAGGSATTLATAYRAYGVAVDGQRVYWSDGPTIRSLPLDGSGPAIIHATGQSVPWDLAVDGAAIYWVDWGAGTVMKVAK